MKISKDTLIFGVIYLVVLSFVIHYNLTHSLINDGVYEYRGYLLNIQEGWKYRYSSINSVLVSIWLPAMIQRLTNWDAMTLFRVFPAFFYALMPSFVYLISRRYLGIKYAITSAMVVVFSSYIFFFPDVGRNGVVLGMMSGMVWALLTKKLIWAVGFAVLVVFAHYATAIITIGLLGAVLGGMLLWRRVDLRACYPLLRNYLVVFCVLVVLTGFWHFGIAHYSGDSMWHTLFRPDEARNILDYYYKGTGETSFFSLESRDTLTQTAFGLGFWANPMPLKVEIVSNWLIVAFISLGMCLMLKKKEVDIQFRIMLLALYGLVVATVLIPSLSYFYGTQRVYFTAMVVLATCFPFGITKVAEWLHIPPMILSVVVLGLYAASTSGLIYLPFGLAKSIPVYKILP